MSSSLSYSPRAKLAISGLKVAKYLVNRFEHSLLGVESACFSDDLNTEYKKFAIKLLFPVIVVPNALKSAHTG
jgi:hypothetical protein